MIRMTLAIQGQNHDQRSQWLRSAALGSTRHVPGSCSARPIALFGQDPICGRQGGAIPPALRLAYCHTTCSRQSARNCSPPSKRAASGSYRVANSERDREANNPTGRGESCSGDRHPMTRPFAALQNRGSAGRPPTLPSAQRVCRRRIRRPRLRPCGRRAVARRRKGQAGQRIRIFRSWDRSAESRWRPSR
jgi:hypothetical protein